MTVISDAYINITSIVLKIDEANKYLDGAEEKLNFDMKKLEEIQKQHPMNIYKVRTILNGLKSIEEFIEVRLKEIESIHWRKYNETYSRALSTRDIQAYIAGEPDYKTIKELNLEVNYVKSQVEALYEALVSMGYQIKNVTSLRIAELEEVIV
jgi:hypothetical protein